MATLESALKVDPNFVEAHLNLARLLARDGRDEEAKSHQAEAARLQRERDSRK